MRIELNSADVPYIYLPIKNLETFIPFRHTLEFFTKSDEHDMWSFEDMDENEFTHEMRKIHDWNFILALDRAYNHGTMICCMDETLHGKRLSIHSQKNYRINNSMNLEYSLKLSDEEGPTIFKEVESCILELQSSFPLRINNFSNVSIRPEGKVCVYTMNSIRYTHTHL